ncbi:MAG: hypothetical protein C6W57_11485 [Caldibacillus debilis]|nr:MAG: hypothetical protein C6W57_11485 [Caldibacillus debilis]
MDGSPHDGADFCFLWLAFLKQYINIPQSRRFPFLWPVSPEKDAPGKGKRPCHAGECRFRRHTKTETGCTTSTPHAEKCRFRRLPAFYERGSALRGREVLLRRPVFQRSPEKETAPIPLPLNTPRLLLKYCWERLSPDRLPPRQVILAAGFVRGRKGFFGRGENGGIPKTGILKGNKVPRFPRENDSLEERDSPGGFRRRIGCRRPAGEPVKPPAEPPDLFCRNRHRPDTAGAAYGILPAKRMW